MEVIFFPRIYEMYRSHLEPDSKILVLGRVSLGDSDRSKIICDRIVPFKKVPKEIWLKFSDKDEFNSKSAMLEYLRNIPKGDDDLIIYLEKERQRKSFTALNLGEAEDILQTYKDILGSENIAIRYKKVLKKS